MRVYRVYQCQQNMYLLLSESTSRTLHMYWQMEESLKNKFSYLYLIAYFPLISSLFIKFPKKNNRLGNRHVLTEEEEIIDALLKKRNNNSRLEEVNKQNYFEKQRSFLEQADIGITYEMYLALTVIAAIGCTLIMYFIMPSMLIALTGLIGGVVIPKIFINKKHRHSLEVFEKQFVKALRNMAASVKASSTVQQAIKSVAVSKSMPYDIRKQFERVSADISYGATVSDAFYDLYKRTNSRNVKYLAISTEIQMKYGGNMAQLFDKVAKTITTREIDEGKKRATLAQNKMSSLFLSFIPFIMIGIVRVVNPEYFAPLLDTQGGRILMFICFATIFIGIGVLDKMADIK